MLHQPRVPPTGQRQAVEIQIKWREVLAQKQALLNILTKTTGHSVEKLDKVLTAALPSCFLALSNAGCRGPVLRSVRLIRGMRYFLVCCRSLQSPLEL